MEAFTVRTFADCAAIAAAAAGVPGAAGMFARGGIATRSPPWLAQSAAVPGNFTNVPFMHSATALSDGGSADAGVTAFCGAGGTGAEAGTRSRGAGAGVPAGAVAGALGATRGGAPCAAARAGFSEIRAPAAARPINAALVVMVSPRWSVRTSCSSRSRCSRNSCPDSFPSHRTARIARRPRRSRSRSSRRRTQSSRSRFR